uniref:Large ribosomal subunit protein bL21c n=1 Tax=Caloglossa intermedia TaxID=100879 RepID=A0A1Z1M641_9FLOR|nr:ribosomal protein L21 [Caloglossa intermedia]ARW61372.1 ribosomal protein L21 [Caloglossa intermedia]
MTYAIVEAGGKQVWMQAGKFYDINYVPGNPGDVIELNRVLFMYKDNIFKIGTPFLQSNFVKAKILRHVKGKKITVFKIKPKKNARCKKGHRQKLTRLLVQSII